jgi:hypothetical protein
MKNLPSTIGLFVCILLMVPQPVLAISIIDRVNEVSRWFTGNFDNSDQVSRNPSIPLVPLSTCSVQLLGGSAPMGTQNLYLAQPTLNRFRLYSFEPDSDSINLGIRSFINIGSASGICNRPQIDRVVTSDSLAAAACNLELTQDNYSYIGNNAPIGCPTRTGGRVVSNIVFQSDSSISLDLIYDSSNRLIFGTQIEFQRITEVPEPSTYAGTILAICGWCWWQWQRKQR